MNEPVINPIVDPIVDPIWAGPSLYVPMHVDALLVGQGNQGTNRARTGQDYPKLTGNADPAPAPFQNNLPGTSLGTGIHLQWTLPDALRHGRQPAPDSPKIDFPPAPNRWLITRFFRTADGVAPAVTAWVLESDWLGAIVAGASSYPDPVAAARVFTIGKQYTLEQWPGTPGPATPFLRGTGPGDVSWAAIYDNVRNVFAFHDSIGTAAGTCAYSVLGWYAVPKDDPLFGAGGGFTTEEEWKSIMESLLWGVGSGDDDPTRIREAREAFQKWLAANPVTGGPAATPAQKELASQTICHGLLFDAQWSGPASRYDRAPILEAGRRPAVAIGSNSAEALGAWMGDLLKPTGADPFEVEDLLVAFQLNKVFEYTRQRSGFEIAAHAARFGTQPSGKLSIVIRPEDREGEGTGGVQQIALDPAQTAKLAELNAKEREQARLAQKLGSLRWELFAAGWKLERAEAGEPIWQQIAAYIAKLANEASGKPLGEIPALLEEIAGVDTARIRLRAELVELLKKDGEPQFVVAELDLPPFAQSADPVVLIAGLSADSKYQRAPFGGDPRLFTRFTGQSLGGIEIRFDGIAPRPSVTLDGADLLGPLSLPSGKVIPKETKNLWLESLLLDLGNATWFAKLAFAKSGPPDPTPTQLQQLSERIRRQQTLVWNAEAAHLDERTIAEAAGLRPLFPPMPVTVPAKSSVAKYAPAWSPLYLDWEIEWHPTAARPQEMLRDWKMGGFEFEWTSTAVTPAASKIAVRTQLTVGAAPRLADSLNEFLKTPDLDKLLPLVRIEQLRKTAQELVRYDVMTQSLTGLIEQMVMHKVEATRPLANAAARKFSEGAMTWVPRPEAPFFPIRAGHALLTRLQVVDAFGQVLAPWQPGPLLPIRSRSLITQGTNNSGYVQLVPRIAQQLRLDFTLLDAASADDRQPVNSSDATSPICGWLLPNHLDESLLVFDAKGNSLGEVLKIERDSGPGLRWDAAPGTDAPLGAPPRIPNRHLLAMISALLQRGAKGTEALDQLLDLIDVTLWSTDPLGSSTDGNLSVLIGRPIAVVRASAGLRFDGLPAYDQRWAQTGKNDTAGFENVPFPLRIGDLAVPGNGALGYFVADAYDACYAMYGYKHVMGSVRRALSRRSPDPRAALRQLLDGERTVSSAAGDYVVTGHLLKNAPADPAALLTILVDPRGSIPAITACLPVQQQALPNGPVDTARMRMSATFRMGPLLVDPSRVQVPLPAATGGKWSWIERSGVTFWREQGPLEPLQNDGSIPSVVPTLREGWLKLSGALGKEKS